MKENAKMYICVDRGWSWVVLVAVFLSTCVSALPYMAGLFNVQFMQEFDMDASVTALSGSISNGAFCFSGPLASVLYETIGARKTMVIASSVASIGYLASAFVTYFPLLCITFGVLGGLGLGSAFLTGVIALGFYFDKYRNLAYGIASAGAGVGIMIWSPFVNYLIYEYGWRGSCVIIAAFLLHFYVFALVLLPTDAETTSDLKKNVTNIEKSLIDIGAEYRSNGSFYQELRFSPEDSDKNICKNAYNASRNSALGTCNDTRNATHESYIETGQFGHVTCKQPRNPTHSPEHQERKEAGNNRLCFSTQDVANKKQAMSSPKTFSHSVSNIYGYHGTDSAKNTMSANLRNQSILARMSADLMTISTTSLTKFSEKKYKSKVVQTKGKLLLQSTPDKDANFERDRQMCNSIRNVLRLFTNSRYVLFCCNFILVNFVVAILYLHLPAYALSKGTSGTQISTLMSVVGVANIICRLLSGAITTNKRCSSTLYYNVLLLSLAVLLVCAPIYGGYYAGQIVLAAIAGMCNSQFVLMSPFVIEFAGLEALSFGYGFLILLAGLGFLFGPPFAGFLYDMSGSYSTTFYFIGGCLLLSVLFMVPIPFIGRRAESREPSEETDTTLTAEQACGGLPQQPLKTRENGCRFLTLQCSLQNNHSASRW